jgi:tetratricopeptide (TPR) repeat protein
MEPGDRLLQVELVRTLQERERWQEALTAVAEARARFPDDFNLALMDVRTLLQVGRAADATVILADLQVLPSESGRESHRLWEWAHTLVALDALDAGDAGAARGHLEQALEWPESLGQGRPYEPEERLVRYLLGVAEERLGDAAAARENFEAVVRTSGVPSSPGAAPSRLDALAVRALRALGRPTDALPTIQPPTSSSDLEGLLLQRALSLGAP